MKPHDRMESDSAWRRLEIRMRDQDDFWVTLAAGSLLLVVSGLVFGAILRDIFPSSAHVNRVRNCQEALTRLDGAIPTESDLVFEDGTGYLKVFPRCPEGKYVIGPVGLPSRCTSGLPGHCLEAPAAGSAPR